MEDFTLVMGCKEKERKRKKRNTGCMWPAKPNVSESLQNDLLTPGLDVSNVVAYMAIECLKCG